MGLRGLKAALIVCLAAALAGGAVWLSRVSLRPERPVPPKTAFLPEKRLRSPSAGRQAPEEAAQGEEPAQPQPLPTNTIRRMVEGALARIELLDDRGERLRDETGLLLEGGTSVLSRFRPLLGAYRGVARIGPPGEARPHEILGLISYDPYRNLSLLEIAPEEGLSGVPVWQGGSEAMAAGMEVIISSTGNAVETVVSEYPYVTPDGVSRARLAAEPPLPAGARIAVDLSGAAVGLCSPEPDGSVPGGRERGLEPAGSVLLDAQAAIAAGLVNVELRRLLLDPLDTVASGLGNHAAITLAEVTRRFYEGTFAHLFDQARRAMDSENSARALELLDRALEQVESEGVSAADVQAALDLLARAIQGELDRRRRESDVRGAAAILKVATRRFPADRRLWVDLGAAQIVLGDYREAIAALSEARRLEEGTDLDALLQRAYLEAAQKELSVGRPQLAAEWLQSGIEALPASARMHLELAKLYQRLALYDEASRVYLAARSIDPGLAPEVDAALERIEDLMRRREALVLEIPEGSSTIQSDVVLNGAASYRFIIDPGATYTCISQDMADALGYQVGATSERVILSTANGDIVAPLVVLESVNLHGYAVRNVKAAILRNQRFGLLGLNFLDHFRYTIDRGRREFRLEKR
jgi:clan AA aspartic protease (TIGR02281 family)